MWQLVNSKTFKAWVNIQIGKQEVNELLINKQYFNKGQINIQNVIIDDKDIRIEYGPFNNKGK